MQFFHDHILSIILFIPLVGMIPLVYALGFILGFQIALFAFGGIELVGTAAAETKDPMKTMPRAINSIPIRVMLFYVGALTVIMAVNPWRTINAGIEIEGSTGFLP